MTSAPGPFLTMRAGGPLNGSIALSANIDDGVLVEATWTCAGELRTASQTVEDYESARELAQRWAHTLDAGREPEAT